MKSIAGSGVFEMLNAVSDFENHHLPPIAGGMEDQTPEFKHAVRRVLADKAWLEAQTAG